MAAGSIIIELLARTGSFITDIDRATKVTEKRMKELQKTAKDFGVALGASFAAAGAAAIYFSKQVIDGLDALNDVADATGSSIENLSALEDVAVRTGTTMDNVSGILVKFNNVLKEADGKNGVSQALEAIGLNAKELKRLDPAEALRQTAVALSEFADDGNKARLVQELFGKSVKDAAPFLKDLAEQGRLNATVTSEQTENAEALNKQIFGLQKNFTDAARSIVSDFVPALNDILKAFNEGGLKSALDTFGNIAFDWEGNNSRKQLKLLESDITDLKKELAATDKGFAARLFGESGLGYITADAKSIQAELDAKVAEYEKISTALLRSVADAAGDSGLGSAEPERPAAPKVASSAASGSKKVSEFEKYLDQLKKQLDKVKELSTEEQLLSDIQEGRLGKLNAQQQETLVNLAKQVDLHKRLDEQIDFEGEGYKFLAEEQKKFAAEAARINEETRTPFEVYTKGLEDLDKLLAGSFITLETYTRATEKLGDEYVRSGKKVEEATDEFSEFAKQAERNIQDALGNTLEDALSGNFDNIGKMWLKLIQQMAAQALAARLNEQLFGKGGSGGVDWGSLFSSVAGAFSGGGGAGLAIGMDSVPYDNFPALLHRGERVMTAADNKAFSSGQGMGGSVNITQNIQVGSNVSLPDVKAAMETTKQETLAVIARSRRQEYTR